MSSHRRASHALAAGAFALAALGAPGAPAEPALVSQWSFENGAANTVSGAPAGKVEKARQVEGHAGKALAFEDWSIKDYLKPDPRIATRVVVPHDPKLNPPYPFRVSAWIYPTADPVYFGGIVEKGRGYGASYRLVLLRGLKVEAALGGQRVAVKSPAPVALNAWHEVGLTADGKTLALWVDGERVAQAALASPAKPASTEPLIVGERFTGRIDEVSISAE